MGIETREAKTEALKSDITTKEKNLAGRLEKGAGLVAMALFITSSAMAEKAVEKIPTEPEKIKTELLKIMAMNKTKPILLEQMKLVKEPFAAVRFEEGKIKIETPKVEVKKPEVSEAEPEIKLAEKEKVEKKSPLG